MYSLFVARTFARDLPIHSCCGINYLLRHDITNLAGIHPASGKNSHETRMSEELKCHRKHNCTGLRMTRVLLVEDSEDVLYLVQLQLQWLGYLVDSAKDASAALEAATTQRPDVIVSDLRMPGIDGFELIRQVRSMRSLSSVPAIALTGAATEADVQQAIASGFTAHLTKPVDTGELAKLIEQLTAPHVQRKAG
jgi:CheY-like chemotaxis protein